ncbi:Cnl2/NKP2 family protein-domain-containing protein [Phyllosticta citrichinensis]|uniref:Cnl2/NKP2 family protein-domain-containing protein n=1 Tax=Phyllosticta citrichinensis TaxID=1130410 RepID=A0ABR1Y0U0_9PEZI
MPHTETSLLSDLLLRPAPLTNVITLQQFIDLFPRSQASNPAIPRLYRELQHQRATDIDDVKRSIAGEAKRGEQQARQVAKRRRKEERGELEEAGLTPDERLDVQMDEDLYGPLNAAFTRRHGKRTIEDLLQDMKEAEEDLNTEIGEIEEEAQAILGDVKKTVDDLSDLRYGKFPKPAAGEELGQATVETLKQLQAVCAQAGDG